MEIDEDNDFVVNAHNKLSSRLQAAKGEKHDSFLERQVNNNETIDHNIENNSAPMKLEVSESENDSSEIDETELYPLKEKQIIEKKLRYIKNYIKTNSGFGRSRRALKRKGGGGDGGGDSSSQTSSKGHYSSETSDDYVLGFDETNGEVHTIKNKEVPSKCFIKVDEKETEKILNELKPEDIADISYIKKFSKISKMNEDKVVPTQKLNNNSDFKSIQQKQESLNDRKHIVGDLEESDQHNLSHKAYLLANMKFKEERFKKPFELGWRREVVWRIHPSGKEKADIYFLSPTGKKFRSRNEITPFIANNESKLHIDDFSFSREPLGLSEEFETVRHAKNLSRSSLSLPPPNTDISTPSSMGKRISKPKVPKGASPPPEDWTPTKAIKMNNSALQTGRNPPATSTPSNPISPPSLKRSSSSLQNNSSSSKNIKNRKPSSNVLEKQQQQMSSSINSNSTPMKKEQTSCQGKCLKPHEPSTQIKCRRCLKIFHPECVGLKPTNNVFKTVNDVDGKNATKRDYTCENCFSSSKANHSIERKERGDRKRDERTKSSAKSMKTPQKQQQQQAQPPQQQTSPAKPIEIPELEFPQTLAVVKGKKYVMVSKPFLSNLQNDSESEDLKKKVTKTIKNIKKARASEVAPVMPIVPSLINSNQQFAANFFSNVSSGYDSLIHVLKYLKIHERSRAASVCKLWYLATKDQTFWRTIRMKNSKVCDWTGFAAALRRGETKQLDLRKMLLSSNSRSEEAWKDFLQQIGTVYTLEVIDMCRCSAKVIESLFRTNKSLRILNALSINDTALDLENVKHMNNLEELRLRSLDACKLKSGLQPLQDLNKIVHLSLTGIQNLGTDGVEILGNLKTLESLELGECGQIETSFAQSILPKLKNLKRLRMENNQYATCETLSVVKAVSSMKSLEQLELVNFDIKPGFDLELGECKYLRKLLIIPTYISQSATTNNVVLSAIQKIANTIQVFTWGVTIELLRVTALYVDQCDGSSKKEKQFDECIPVLKPVPGALCDDELKDDSMDDESESDVPQIEILPLERVENILANNLPNTKYFIVKIPYQATCKQHLVE